MVSPVPVYIESQVTRRDLHARLLLGARLAAHGHPVLLGRDHAILAAAAVNAPGIYISDWGFTHSAARRLAAMRAHGHQPYGQCEESTAYVAPDLYRRIRLVPAALAETTAVFCTNGQQQALVEAQRPEIPVDRMPAMTNPGNIRFELLGPRWRGAYQPEITQIKDRFGDFVLITTNGKLRNVRDVEHNVEHLQKNIGLSRPDAERFGQLIEQRAEAQRRFIQDVLALAESRPRRRFVLRAKYNEIRPIEELFGDRLPANVTLENGGGIQAWVLAADGVLMNNCTTGMDAHVAGTPAIFYRPTGDTVENLEGPAALSTLIDGPEALAAALDRGLPDNPALDAAAVERFMPSLVRSSHQAMADAITAAAPASDTRAFPGFHVPLRQRLPLWRKSVVHRLSPSRSLGGRIQAGEVKRFMAGLRDADDTLRPVQLRQLDFELYRLSP